MIRTFDYEIIRTKWKMNIKPTDSELEILNILWDKGTASVREVHEVLAKSKDAGYTTTLKLMQIMHEKGLLKRDESARSHLYTANVAREATQQQIVKRMIDNVFNGSASTMVMQALGNHKTSTAELDAIKKYLAEIENNMDHPKK